MFMLRPVASCFVLFFLLLLEIPICFERETYEVIQIQVHEKDDSVIHVVRHNKISDGKKNDSVHEFKLF